MDYKIYHNEEKILPNVSDQACEVQFGKKGEKNEAMDGERNNHPGIMVAIRHVDSIYLISYDVTVDSYFNEYIPVMEQVINSFRILR